MTTKAKRIEVVMTFLKSSSEYATRMLETVSNKETPEEGFEDFKAMIPESKEFYDDALDAIDYTSKESFLNTITECLGEASGISLIKGLTLAWTTTGNIDVDGEFIYDEFSNIMSVSSGFNQLMKYLEYCRDNNLPLMEGITSYSESESSEQIIVDSSIEFLKQIAETGELFNPNNYLDHISRNIILTSVNNIYDHASEGVAEQN